MKELFYNRKLVVSIFVVLILLTSAIAIGPVLYSLFMGAGVKTEGIDESKLEASSTDLDGQWNVVQGDIHNFTSVGFTFFEVLPAEEKETSGSTTDVTGEASISNGVMEQARVVVAMDTLTTDKEVRDQNMKDKLFITEDYPEATFELSEPADLSGLPEDGTVGEVELTGELTIKDKTNLITHTFDAVRSGDQILIAGDVPINRLDYDVITPELIAATIDEQGDINLRIALQRQ